MKKKLMMLVLCIITITGAAVAYNNNSMSPEDVRDTFTSMYESFSKLGDGGNVEVTEDPIPPEELRESIDFFEKMLRLEDAELTSNSVYYSVTCNESSCTFVSKDDKSGDLPCIFPINIAKKYAANFITVDNILLEGGSLREVFEGSSPMSNAFFENISLQSKYCKQ